MCCLWIENIHIDANILSLRLNRIRSISFNEISLAQCVRYTAYALFYPKHTRNLNWVIQLTNGMFTRINALYGISNSPSWQLAHTIFYLLLFYLYFSSSSFSPPSFDISRCRHSIVIVFSSSLRLHLLRICLNNGKRLQLPFPFVYHFYLFHW